MLEASSSLGSTKLIATEPISHQTWKQIWNIDLNSGASAQGAYDARPCSRRNRGRDDQDMDAKNYTEARGKASNCRSSRRTQLRDPVRALQKSGSRRQSCKI